MNSSPSIEPALVSRPRFIARRWVRRGLWSAVTFVVLLVLAVQILNWSGARALKDAVARLEAAGETIDFRATLAKPVPDAENFCATPALQGIVLDKGIGENAEVPVKRRERLMKLSLSGSDASPPPPQRAAGVVTGVPLDAGEWLRWLRETGQAREVADLGSPAATLLQALESDEDLLQELGANLDRPFAQWTPAWLDRELPEPLFSVILPHYTPLQGVTRNWCLRASAAAQSDAPAEAHLAVRVTLRIAEASLEDPYLIGLLVGVSQLRQVNSAIWELCHNRVGSAENFRTLEMSLRGLDLNRYQLQAYRTELAAAFDTLQWTRANRNGSPLVEGVFDFGSMSQVALNVVPDGFYNHCSAKLIDTYYRHLIVPVRDQTQLVSHDAMVAEMLGMKNDWITGGVMVASLLPAVSSANRSVTYARCQLDFATLACALERHFLTHGNYPLHLADLADGDETQLPKDPTNSEPYRYEPTTDGRYRLWSPGFDGTDDGGVRALSGQASRPYAEGYKGDWVWDYPASASNKDAGPASIDKS